MKPVRRIVLAAALALALVVRLDADLRGTRAHEASAAVAQTRRPMTLVDVANLPRALDPAISPDGRWVTYMLQAPDWTTGRYVAHIWKQPTAGGAPTRVTSGPTADRIRSSAFLRIAARDRFRSNRLPASAAA